MMMFHGAVTLIQSTVIRGTTVLRLSAPTGRHRLTTEKHAGFDPMVFRQTVSGHHGAVTRILQIRTDVFQYPVINGGKQKERNLGCGFVKLRLSVPMSGQRKISQKNV